MNAFRHIYIALYLGKHVLDLLWVKSASHAWGRSTGLFAGFFVGRDDPETHYGNCCGNRYLGQSSPCEDNTCEPKPNTMVEKRKCCVLGIF